MSINLDAEMKKMEREYSRLLKCFSDFNAIKHEVAALVACTPTDTDIQSKKKQDAIQRLLPDGIKGIERDTKEEIKKLNTLLKQLDTQLKHSLVHPK